MDDMSFTMTLDASDLRSMMAGHVNAYHGGGEGGRGGGGDVGAMMGGGGTAGGGKANPSFMSIFKPLAALAVIEKILGGILRNSQIANQYMGAMGKIFGSAIDLLLVPFIPLFNLLMVGVSKLVAWLVTSGALEKLAVIMERATKYLEAIISWVGKVVSAVKDMNFSKLAGLLVQGVISGIKVALTDPLGAIAAGLTALAAAYMANKMMGGIPGKILGMGGRALGMGGMGGGTVAGGGGNVLRGAAGLGSGLVAGATLVGGGLGLLGGKKASEQLGLQDKSGTHQGILGKLGLNPLSGLNKALPTWMGGGGGKKNEDAAAGGTINSGNVINVTQNINSSDGKQTAADALDEMKRRTGFQLANRS